MQDELISRQAAIDAFERFIHELGIKDEPYNYGEMALSVQNVPSVNPQYTEDEIQKMQDLEQAEIQKAHELGKAEETRWIPVSESERLPTDIVLLSLPPHIAPDGEECSASVICGHYIGGKDKEWGLSDGDTFGYGIVSIRKGTNPIAWMPLPAPFEPQESEVQDAYSN